MLLFSYIEENIELRYNERDYKKYYEDKLKKGDIT